MKIEQNKKQHTLKTGVRAGAQPKIIVQSGVRAGAQPKLIVGNG